MGGRVQGFWNSDSIRADAYKRARPWGHLFSYFFFLTEELCHWRNLRNWSYTKFSPISRRKLTTDRSVRKGEEKPPK